MKISDLVSLRRPVLRFFPPACAGCDGFAASQGAFCSVCQMAAMPIYPPYCERCRVPMEQFGDSRTNSASLCSRCHQLEPCYERVWAHWEYGGAVADAIRRIKYGGDLPALRALCRGAREWFCTTLEELPRDAPLIPVPAHRSELRRRGFHVPSLALRLFGKRLESSRVDRVLRKKRPTSRQASLPFAARRKNVESAFATTPSSQGGGPAILFDDVLTTGATVDAASRALCEAGFGPVYVLVLARAPRPNF